MDPEEHTKERAKRRKKLKDFLAAHKHRKPKHRGYHAHYPRGVLFERGAGVGVVQRAAVAAYHVRANLPRAKRNRQLNAAARAVRHERILMARAQRADRRG